MPEEPEHIEEIQFEPHSVQKRKMPLFVKVFFFGFLALLILFSLGIWHISHLNTPPENFPTNQSITIAPGTDVRSITEQLETDGVVRSAQFLYWMLIFTHDPSSIKASTYLFDEPLNTTAVALKLTEGDFDTDLIRFTHFEGERVSLLAKRAGEQFVNFDTERFLENTQNQEGKIFPETYFVPPNFSDLDLLALMQQTYTEKLEPFQEQILSHPLTEDEIIILASIIEREANTPESMRMVSGILQNRLAIGMALQADASIEYVVETPLGQLPAGQLAEELRELDSPYNTYLYPGLPPTAIGNPGLEAITAVLEPTESDFFYYLTNDDGEFFYSETYDQHLENIRIHLR